jgi:hypothetical protein
MRVGLAYLQYQTPIELRLARDDYRVSNATWNRNRGQAQKFQPVQKLPESIEVMAQ